MINVTEEISRLTQQENQLHTSLDDLRGQRSKAKEYKQVEKELATVLHKSQNLQAWAVFEVGMPVYRLDSTRLGIVKGKNTTPGGMREIWVSWDGTIEIPEQPNLLQIDGAAMAKIIAVGDRIEIRDGHQLSGKTFTVATLLARGAVETIDEIVFQREDWQKIEATVMSIGKKSEELADSNCTLAYTEIEMVEQDSTEALVARSTEGELTVESAITTIQEIGELTEDEEWERHRLELKVERAYVEAGTALRKLRDKRLYRSTHRTFDAYCQERFGLSSRHSYRLIESANVIDNLKEFCDQFGHILPAKESVCRFLTSFQPNQQIFAWQQILQETGGKYPTGKQAD